ncbi:MAG: hypothetical protein QNJ81_15575 [Acidimicrobiia bacterium]|nr:hypothetical protein [Acidimicrobiia bacterium]
MAYVVAAILAQVREPIPPPPYIFDLIVSAIFVWIGWKAWKRGKTWRSGALVMWLLALAGLYTFIRGITVG